MATKKYFFNIEYSRQTFPSFNKFIFGTCDLDMEITKPLEMACKVISDNHHGIDLGDVTINITALNPV